MSYPGLETDPHHAALKRLMNPGFGYGGMLAFDTGSRENAFALMDSLQNDGQFGFLAVCLEYFDTLMSCSAASTSSELSDDDLRAAGIQPGLVRMSIGYTGDLEDRWAEPERSLGRLGLL